jgi:sterol desaturase/sphingolipid hydroxylase (fatty acid hydroxylase superfamily)
MMLEHLWWYVFGVGFLLTGVAETFLPFRSLPSSTVRRWTSNLVLLGVSSILAALALQVGAVALSVAIRNGSHGLLNRPSVPYLFQFLAAFVLLDLVTYALHRLFHRFGLLWRVHEVHHAETDLDLTTGFRFHPIEALAHQGAQLGVIALLGPPPAAVVLAGIAVVLQDYVQHANLRFPESVDRVLRTIVVTPAMHRVHHSVSIPLQNKNFGTIFSWWDRIFGTYAVDPEPASARFGLEELQNGSELNAGQLLALPFRGTARRFTPLKVRGRIQATD